MGRMSSISAPLKSAPVTLPPIPIATLAYRRALREKLCVGLAAAAYDEAPLAKPSYVQFSHPQGTVGDASALFAFAYLEDGTAYIAFRGTDNARNWLSNFHITPKGRPLRHRGFDNCWRRLKSQIEQWLEQNKPREIVLTGHSLGGAMAQLGAIDLAPSWLIRAVVCFGAPLVGWQAFATAYDRTAIKGLSGATLGDVTTTYVFKSDLVRFLLLPRLGFTRNGIEIIIDETGRPSDRFLPWYLDAFGHAYTAITGDESSATFISGRLATSSGRYAIPFAARQQFEHNTGGGDPFIGLIKVTQAPPLTVRMVVDQARPYVAPIVSAIPHLQTAALAVGALMAAYWSGKFLKRDASYHSAHIKYASAMAERVGRWVPLAYQEKGDELLVAGDAAGALSYLSAALETAEADARSCGMAPPELHRLIWRLRIGRAAAHAALADYPAAIADLTTHIDSYPKGPIKVAAAADGSFSIGPQILAVARRALAYEEAGWLPEAMADYVTLLAADTDLSFAAFQSMRDQARRTVGAAGKLKAAMNFRASRVQAETGRLIAQHNQAFQSGMASTWEWAHFRRAACAFQLKDYATAVSGTTAAITLNGQNGEAYQLRGAAHARQQRRDEALEDFTTSIEIDPKNAEAYYTRGHTRMMAGAVIKEPDDGSDMATIETRLRRKDVPLVEQDFRKTLEIDPSHAMARRLLEAIADMQVSSRWIGSSEHREF